MDQHRWMTGVEQELPALSAITDMKLLELINHLDNWLSLQILLLEGLSSGRAVCGHSFFSPDHFPVRYCEFEVGHPLSCSDAAIVFAFTGPRTRKTFGTLEELILLRRHFAGHRGGCSTVTAVDCEVRWAGTRTMCRVFLDAYLIARKVDRLPARRASAEKVTA